MGKTTYSGPINSLAGFLDNGVPINSAPDAGDIKTTALIDEGSIEIPAGTSIQAALQALAAAIAALET